MGFELRPYQKECIKAIDGLPDGARSIVCLATGLGKSIIGANIPHKGKMLWLSHRDELVRQPEKYFKAQGLSYGIEKAGEHACNEDVISASVQTLSKDNRLHEFKPDTFDLIVCDEAHHAAADTYKKVLGYFHPRKLIGLTATPNRGDGKGLNDVFDSICFSRDLRWGIEHGYLSRIRNVRVYSDFDMNKVKKNMGDFSLGSLEDVIMESNTDTAIANAYRKYCLPEKKPTLVFCPTLSVCQQVADTLIEKNPEEKGRVAVLSDKTDSETRRKILKDYTDHKIHCIVNCMILTEGADLPSTSVVINARPTANDSLYQQIVGRGTRLCEGKDFCLVIDIVGKNYKDKNICTAPSLFGIDMDQIPKKAEDKINENTDLIDFADALSEEDGKVSYANAIKLRYEMYDIFTHERVEFTESSMKLEDKAEEYVRKFIEPYTHERDFDGICVKHTPTDERYYRIDATYNDRIYLSKPDMLDNTHITMICPDEGYNLITKDMPMKQAVKFVKEYLTYVIPPYFSNCWSINGRAEMARKPITSFQARRIAAEYKKLGIREKDTYKLNRLQASDLIGLAADTRKCISESQKMKAEIADCSKKRKGAKKEQWDKQKAEEVAKKKATAEALRANADRQLRDIESRINKEKGAETVKRKRNIASKDIERACPDEIFDLHVTNAYYNMGPVTDKQASYIRGLADDIKNSREGASMLSEPVTDFMIFGLNRWQAGVFINYLSTAKSLTSRPHYYMMEFNIGDAIKKISTLSLKAGETNRTVTFKYRYLIPELKDTGLYLKQKGGKTR